MNIILWNCRGVGSKGFRTLLGDLRLRYKVNFFVLFETHASGSKAQKVIKCLGFDGFFYHGWGWVFWWYLVSLEKGRVAGQCY